MRKVYDVAKPAKKAKKQKDLAKAVARKGRKGDSTLVHMHPSEVKMLQGLAAAHGKPMTTNPTTGLPEAFNLKKILKTALPIAASIFGTPALGAAVSAGMTKADGGSWKEALTSGATSLALSGAAGAAGKALTTVAPAATAGAAQAVAPSMLDMAGKAATAAMPYAAIANAANNAETQMRDARLAAADDEEKRRRGEGILAQGLDPSQYHYAEGGPVEAGRPSPWSTDPAQFKGQAFIPAFDFSQRVLPVLGQPGPTTNPTPDLNSPDNAGLARLLRNQRWPAQSIFGSAFGGLGNKARATMATKQKYADTASAARGDLSMYGPTQSPYEVAFGGLPTVFNNNRGDLSKYFAAGGHVQGPGDGMSDGIAAMIDGNQPAQIASGEYIVPADVVSHLGNGDTNAGVDYLDSQMKQIRQASVGSPKQRNKIDPQNFIR